ncbi:MAG: hypothetical protein DRP55_10665 [Spirochaetes bacterium]|nr:MAG: hypothetical protein DRP55_10665 [Spirochaetota bacterium]
MGSGLEAAVGMSRRWDAREAGREVARSTIEKLNRPPDFFLLFSTIHYKNPNGFRDFLVGVWDVLPADTPLIGGTVAAFINNYGCFSRGVTALAVSYSNINVALGFGRNTKLHPRNAAKHCVNMIKNGLKTGDYGNKFLIDIISGPTVPNIPFMGRKNFVKSKVGGSFASSVGVRVFPLFGHGLGKEDDIVDYLTSLLPDYYFVGGSTLDTGDMFMNYQFIGEQVLKNSVVALGVDIDKPVFLDSMLGAHQLDIEFDITESIYKNRIITKIDDKPAKERFLGILRINEEQFNELGVFYYKTSNYFPITFRGKEKYTTGVAGFLGDNIVLGHKARGQRVKLLSVTGKEVLNVVEKTFQNISTDFFPFVFMSTSNIFFNMLGEKVYSIKNKLDEYIKDIPYLLVSFATENAGTPTDPAVTRVYSFNTLSVNSCF